MAKAKKKSAKKATKKAAKKSQASKRPAKRKAIVRLSAEERQRLTKPGADLDELVIAFARALRAVARKVKIPGVTASRLESAMRRASKVRARLTVAEEKAEAKLAPLRDATLQAEDAAYRMLLRAKKIADAVGEGEPEVAEAFGTFTKTFSERFARSAPSEEEPPPTT